MHPRAVSKNESLTSSDGMRLGLEYRRTSRQPQKSRFATEKPLLPQASQGLKFKDKVVNGENSIRPPHWDVPFEFVKNAYNLFDVRTRSSGCNQPRVTDGVGKEEELVKYMSKVPAYLQKGQKVQDKVFNIGVLDWERLEKWTVKHEKTLLSERITKPSAASCSSTSDNVYDTVNTEALFLCREKPSLSKTVDFSPVVEPLCGQALNLTGLRTSSYSLIDYKSKVCKKDTPQKRDPVNPMSVYRKEKYLSQDSSYWSGKSPSDVGNYDNEILDSISRKLGCSDSEALKCSENIAGLRLDTPHQHCSGKQKSIVLLLPKEFSGFASSEVHHRSSLHGKSTEHDWGSFSDIFSVDEIHSDESNSEINQSCLPNYAVQNEKELDLKLDTLIKAQGFETPVHLSGMPLDSVENKIEAVTSSSAEMSGDTLRHRQFGFGIARMKKSLSFREGSRQPPVSCTYVTAKSGPAKPGCSTSGESENSDKANMDGRTRASPLRRLLDPLLKSKVANRLNEQSNDLKKKPPIPVQMSENKKPKASTIKALLHLSVNSGLPLFKFVVEINSEIFASTVKNLSRIRKDDVSWLYTFYSVHKVKKRNSGWKNQQVPSGFGYNVVGQMKVSNPYFSTWRKQESKERRMVIESVMYNVDVNKVDAATSELKTSRELAAIVVNMSDTAGKSSNCCNEYNLDDWFSDTDHDKLGHIVVLLPGADHSLPHEGVPSSLINRWRSGGSCDCGGWDIGCKLRILTDKWQHDKVLEVQCDLYDQGEAKQCRPFFSMIPLRDGLFSVEFDAKLTSLQAFSISVALINRQKLAHSANTTDQFTSKQDLKSLKASMAVKSEGPEKHTPHPPLSPVGRV